MNKPEIISLIRTKLTLPMSILEMVARMGGRCRRAQDGIKEMIEKLEKEAWDENTDNRPL